ncbi:metallophosphatase family protein [Aquiflexum sp. LQ15W]|uniref:metallophosphoesterase family protein n=1 Tax=Cognataquiflexum nitidum TaxID=2922272 RepID=UPI001F12DD42|nr:metallophosphoesterase family protein [Cognataquiflexum nitidum]MCH6199404.1 metallophosphatase family protein [Cognataquiflexum nitidum]
MKKIGLISDSHGYIDANVIGYLVDVDEIWHAGDIGDLSILDQLPSDKVLRIITGNIDGLDARNFFPEELWFEVEDLKVGMIHIGGKPPQYAKGVKNLIRQHGVRLFVCGHSHICKVEFDKNLNCLYMNSGAIGQSGFHAIRTLLLFEIESGKIQNLRVVELGKRGR